MDFMSYTDPARFKDTDELYYRYDGYEYPRAEAYKVVKRTAKGAWIYIGYGIKDKFILDDARRRWAYPTKEEALNSYRIRKLRQIEHCREGELKAKEGLRKLGFDVDAELKRFFRDEFDWGL